MGQDIIMWAGGILITVIGALLTALSVVFWNSVKELRQKIEDHRKEGSVEELKQKVDAAIKNIDAVVKSMEDHRKEGSARSQHIYDKIEEERKERLEKHEKAVERLFGRIDSITQVDIPKVKEDISDIRESVAGFGSVYVTRKEWIEGCPQRTRHPSGGG
jgi:predicted Holliday junction resolvase-like endonuclease